MKYELKSSVFDFWVRFFFIFYAMISGYFFGCTGNLLYVVLGCLLFLISFENDKKEKKIKIKLERYK
ncbi:hypothetical protein DRN76_04890 [Methanosarcinales archaeon]|nr:MAG: hypothetical protein DRN76_04890 [Methanosarcinales archaeon]